MHSRDRFFERKKRELGVILNDVQKQAVMHTEGPLLLLASPGSGKTTTLIMRIGYLIEVKGVHPSRIKAITFSRASAFDMVDRFKRFFPELAPVEFSTIHSIAYEVMRDYFRRSHTRFQIIEGNDDRLDSHEGNQPQLHKRMILRQLYEKRTTAKITEDQMDELTTYISLIKNKMIPLEQWAKVAAETCKSVPRAAELVREYEQFKRSQDGLLLIDFDDMLTIANKALEEDADLLNTYQHKYDYLLTDESQDTSLVQHVIVEKLVREHRNVCVVADDDQAIYSWRGADPAYLLNFKRVYPNAETLFMEQNYRSSKDIVQVANQFIKRNKNRYNKNMFTTNPAYEAIKIKNVGTYEQQVEYLVDQIKHVERLSDVAILYRNNMSVIELVNAFERAGIPFYMRDSDHRFFTHWVVEDILNLMRMTFTDKRVDIYEQIYTKVNGYVTRQQLTALKEINNNESVFDNLLNHVPLQDYQHKIIQETKATFQKMKGMRPLQAIRTIRTELGYDKSLERMSEQLGFNMSALVGRLNILENMATSLQTMEQFAERLTHLQAVMKASQFKRGQNVVTFSTLHSAKGLEFEKVYMIDLVKGIIPAKEDVELQHMEEAARLFYVGMTRAKRQLELLTYDARNGEATTVSEFVTNVRDIINPPKLVKKQNEEAMNTKASSTNRGSISTSRRKKMNPNAIQSAAQLKMGQSLYHPSFGKGEVVLLTYDTVDIHFKVGTKRLQIDTCIEMGLLERV